MPKEKSFQVDAALEAALQVFWAKGFEQTTITDLLEATGIQRQSLYNAFGDKNGVFVRALLKYEGDYRRTTFSHLEAMGSPPAAVQAVFDAAVASCDPANGPLGCLLVNTAIDLPLHTPEVQTIVRAGLDEMRSALERLVSHGQVRGEFPASLDPAATASVLQSSLIGLRTLARGGARESDLRAMAAATIGALGLAPAA